MSGCAVSSAGSVAVLCQHGDKPFEFHKRREISWPAERLLASQEGLCSSEIVESSYIMILTSLLSG